MKLSDEKLALGVILTNAVMLAVFFFTLRAALVRYCS